MALCCGRGGGVPVLEERRSSSAGLSGRRASWFPIVQVEWGVRGRAFACALSADRASESWPVTSRSNRIFVGNLPWSCGEQELTEVLQQIGIALQAIAEVEIVYDKGSGRSRGFAYVTLANPDSAQAAIQKIDGYVLQGRRLSSGTSQPYRRSAASQPSVARTAAEGYTKVFIGNLPWGVDEGSLEEIFRFYGKVIDATVVYDQNSGRSRGFGFVTLSTLSEAQEAAKSLNGADCDGRALRVSLVRDKPPE